MCTLSCCFSLLILSVNQTKLFRNGPPNPEIGCSPMMIPLFASINRRLMTRISVWPVMAEGL